MKIEIKQENASSLVKVSGELTAVTAEDFGVSLKEAAQKTDLLILDIEHLEYVASAGLRVFLEANKIMESKNGKFIVRNTKEEVMRIFEITGFCDILELE